MAPVHTENDDTDSTQGVCFSLISRNKRFYLNFPQLFATLVLVKAEDQIRIEQKHLDLEISVAQN